MRCPNPDCPDIELFGVQGRYRDGVVNCPKCGSRLIPDPVAQTDTGYHEAQDEPTVNSDLAEAEIRAADPDDFLMPVVTVDYRHEAEVIKSFFDTHGVPSLVTSDDCNALNPALGFANEATVRVRESDLEAVDLLLDGVEDGLFESYSTFDDPPGIDAAAEKLLRRTHDWAQRLFIGGFFYFSLVLFPVAFVVSVRGLQTVPRDASPAMRILYRRFVVLTLASGFYAFVTLCSAVLGILVMWERG
jgi:hypothetical protein